MKIDEMDNFIKNIQKKLGEENSALISDDLGILITDNASVNQEFEKKETQIKKLAKEKETLINTNGNLLQQVAMGVEEKKEEEKEIKKDFNFNDIFDAKGNFKK